MARTEVAEQRVRHVRVEDLGDPALPPPEEVRQVVDEVEPGERLEEHDGGWRRAGLRLERHDGHLAPLVRREEREQERDDERDDAQAAQRRGCDDESRGPTDRHHVTEAKCHDRRRPEVDRRAEVHRCGSELVPDREQDEAIPEHEPAEPRDEERDGRRGGEEPEEALAPFAAPRADAAHEAPRSPHDVPTEPEDARGRPWDDDRLEDVPGHGAEQDDPGDERDDLDHRSQSPLRRGPMPQPSRATARVSPRAFDSCNLCMGARLSGTKPIRAP